MLIDLERAAALRVPADATAVVGSGAAGLALADALDRAGTPVVLIESGPDVGKDRTWASGLNDGVVQGLPFQLSTGRARVFGGTTALWHRQCVRLQPIDVRTRPWVPNSGWPLDLGDLEPWYEAAERWFDVAVDEDLLRRWSADPRVAPLAWDSRRLQHDWTEYTPLTDIAGQHGTRLRRSRLATVVVNATVARVLVTDGVVRGLEVRTTGGRTELVPFRRVVLAAGAIENARVLQLSDEAGIGLGDGRALTGRFLQTHPVVLTADVTPTDQRWLADRYVAVRLGGRHLFPKVRLAPEAQEAEHLLDANVVLLHEYDDPAFAASRRLLDAVRKRTGAKPAGADLRLALRGAPAVVRDAWRRAARGLPTAQAPSAIRLQVWLEQEPDPDSRLTLGEQTDALGLRRAVAHWRLNEAERRTSRAVTRFVAQDLERLGAARVTLQPAMHDDAAWIAAVRDAAHPSGTTRMAASARQGVVDADLAVHGVRGLWVVGSSVFPTAGYANPTLTIVALALRLAAGLRAEPTTA